MRVLVDGSDVHVWAPAGHFTVHPDHTVTWRTPRVANRDHASMLDDDVVLPPRLGDRAVRDDVIDALELPPYVALVVEDRRVELVELETGSVARSIALRADGPRLPGLEHEQHCPGAGDVFHGSGKRSIRLFRSHDGFWVTAAESGHVAHYSLARGDFDRVWRVPGARENTLFVAERGPSVYVGIKWNGRHSEILHMDLRGELVARWPASRTDVRWGMPAPVVVDGCVVTYSDEGPHREQLALLDGETLEELHHDSPKGLPTDMHADGTRFACVTSRTVTVGSVRDHLLVLDRVWRIQELIEAGGVPAPTRSPHATHDGRGTREWLEEPLAFLRIDGGVRISESGRGEIKIGDHVLVPAAPPVKDIAAAFSASPGPTLRDARAGKVLYTNGTVLVVVSHTGEQLQVAEAVGTIMAACLLDDGVFYVDSNYEDNAERDRVTWRWVASDGEERELSISRRERQPQRPIAVGRDDVWWLERRRDRRWQLQVWTSGSDEEYETIELEGDPLAIAADDKAAYVALRAGSATHVDRITAYGEVERIVAQEELPYFISDLVVIAGRVFVVEPLTHGKDGRNPARLLAVGPSTNAVVATAAVESIKSLHSDGDTLVWLDSTDSGARLMGASTVEVAAAICTLPLSALD
jgi:hypothetical protein